MPFAVKPGQPWKPKLSKTNKAATKGLAPVVPAVYKNKQAAPKQQKHFQELTPMPKQSHKVVAPKVTARFTAQTRNAARYYLAYGSNLNVNSMKSRCKDAQFCGSLMMNDAKLVFRGVADVVFEPGSKVPCGLWRISKRDEEALDRYEGYYAYNLAQSMYRKVEVTLSDGRVAMFYVMNSKGIYPPSQYYVDVIRQGYADFALDVSYLEDAIEDSYLRKEPDEQTKARRQRQRAGETHRTLVDMPLSIQLERISRDQA